MTDTAGRVTVAQSVLHEIVRLTTLGVPGVTRLGARRSGDAFRSATKAGGVSVDVIDNRVEVDVYVLIAPDVNLRDTAKMIQAEIARSMKELVGMDVSNVNVYVQDVEAPAAT